ncbi:MAG: type II toxin-antitoxin system Phd/YefM family antitoxin [Terriglobales bacterium]
MDSVGAFDAKTHLNELLERASQGETIQITRRGVPVARLVPPDALQPRHPRQAAKEIRALRKSMTLGGIKLRQLINEGRRH